METKNKDYLEKWAKVEAKKLEGHDNLTRLSPESKAKIKAKLATILRHSKPQIATGGRRYGHLYL
jgi:hypothetical protein